MTTNTLLKAKVMRVAERREIPADYLRGNVADFVVRGERQVAILGRVDPP